MIRRQVFAPAGMLALAPQAYGAPFDLLEPAAEATAQQASAIAVICVRGPLMSHAGSGFYSYDEIIRDARAALALKPEALVLSIDSPGGLAAGCFECATTLRELAAAAGVPLYAYVDGQACSAAYALACAASTIVTQASASLGSIGVIQPMVDATKQAEMMGLRFVLITSGERKADGNPMAAITDEAVASTQAHVDEMAEMFFAHVSSARGISVEAVRALQAGCFTGKTALGLRLADKVSTLDQLLVAIAAGPEEATAAESKSMNLKDAAQAIIDDEKASDEDKKEAAKYLASLEDAPPADEDEKPKDDAEDEKPPADDKPEASDDKDDAKAIASQALALAQDNAKKLAQGEANAKRTKLLATRPDLTAAQVSAFRKLSPEALASVLAATPKNVAPAAPAAGTPPMAAALATVAGVQPGAEQGKPVFDKERLERRRRMGLDNSHNEPAIRMQGDTMLISAVGKVGAQ
jgi:signal peptide peptidase SppA